MRTPAFYNLIFFSSILASTAAQAQVQAPLQPQDQAQTEETASAWSGAAELGFIDTSGNTDTQSTNAAFELFHKGESWDQYLKLDALTSKEDEETSKEKYNAEIGFDRNFSERSYLALTATHERDRFSGFEYETVVSAGYGYRLIQQERMNLALEAAPGYRRDKLKDTQKINEDFIARFDVKYDWLIRDGVSFIEEFTAEIGDDNSTYRSETGLKSQIVGALATKITYKLKYVEEVPDENENIDRELGITLVYSF